MSGADSQRVDGRLTKSLADMKLLCLDVDGVLTDGSLYYVEQGVAMKAFHARDGYGIRALQDIGICVALISGRDDTPVRKRAKELGITKYSLACSDKDTALRAFCAELDCSLEQVGFMGDDVQDLPAMKISGVAAAPANAHATVLKVANWISVYDGGKGAVRELCDAIISTHTGC